MLDFISDLFIVHRVAPEFKYLQQNFKKQVLNLNLRLYEISKLGDNESTSIFITNQLADEIEFKIIPKHYLNPKLF